MQEGVEVIDVVIEVAVLNNHGVLLVSFRFRTKNDLEKRRQMSRSLAQKKLVNRQRLGIAAVGCDPSGH
jgi:hypothetical protein